MSESTMQAAVFHGNGDLSVDEVPRVQPGDAEVAIKVESCGICGTDMHIVGGDFPVPNLPLILGHEFAGEVFEVGADVENVRPGEKVTADIDISCGTCYFCRQNSKMFCPRICQLGVYTDGAMAEYVVVPTANVYSLPESMPIEHAAYVEPLACVIHGQDRIDVQLGETVAIIGGGSMGLAHSVTSKLNGASCVILSEPERKRRETAKRLLGADIALDPLDTDVVNAIIEVTDGRGADVVIEAVGSIRTYQDALSMVRPGGRVLAFGAAPQMAEMALHPFDVFAKELTIVGSYAGTYETWPKAINLIASGCFDPSGIIERYNRKLWIENP